MKNPIQLLAEGIIPLLGFYYWNWSWAFILFFYFIDWFAKEVLLHLKSRKIIETHGGNAAKETRLKQGLFSFLFLALTIFFSCLTLYKQTTSFDLFAEIQQFLLYKEMGIAQGFILIPIIALGIIMQYKMEFIKQKLFLKLNVQRIWKQHNHKNRALLILVILGYGVSLVFKTPEIIMLITAVISPLIYQFVILRLYRAQN
ncbi:MAG: Ca2+/Na+ antiporter [Lentimonas sp.]|jgi:Ca2+/Na+ antiporter